MLSWLLVANKLHNDRAPCCTAEWPYFPFPILWWYVPYHPVLTASDNQTESGVLANNVQREVAWRHKYSLSRVEIIHHVSNILQINNEKYVTKRKKSVKKPLKKPSLKNIKRRGKISRYAVSRYAV